VPGGRLRFQLGVGHGLPAGGPVGQAEREFGVEVGGWQLTVPVMEFVHEEPLEGELRRRISAALRSVEGVETADEDDTETWLVTVTPAVEALVRAIGRVVDDLADQTRAYVRED
jgi:hypothetical protein